jgi:hypothetical protein
LSNIPTSVLSDTYEGFKKLFMFHIPKPASILDPTCGNRLLWQAFTPQDFEGYNILYSDIKDYWGNPKVDVKKISEYCLGTDPADENSLRSEPFDGIVYDPPYLFKVGKTTDPRADVYGSYSQSYEELLSYMDATYRFKEILKPTGKLIIKCSDQFKLYPISERKFYPLHVTWINRLASYDFDLVDVFVSPHHHINPTAFQVKDRPCSVINHTYFLVFKKKDEV